MRGGKSGSRILIYSHDTFGLGHLRRCRTIAHHLVEHYKGLTVLIISGSPIIGSFDFKARVDFVRIPGVIKLHNGEYTSLGLHIDLEQTLAMRTSIIEHTAQSFAPHLFLVDKEPLGLRGEVAATLAKLKAAGVTTVLGLRDVMDEAAVLRREWKTKRVMPALADLYDEIWIYGTQQMGNPLGDARAPRRVQDKAVFTGYLRREAAQDAALHAEIELREPFLLVTTGGGGDGEAVIDWVLQAYESDDGIPYPALIVFGPFLSPVLQEEFRARVACLPQVQAITFDSHIENLMARSAGVVAMGGYNTFCEILSFDKPAILIPRRVPRQEQLLRAARAEALGLATMLRTDGRRPPQAMAQALRALPRQQRPSQAAGADLLGGLPAIARRVARHLQRPTRAVASGGLRR